MSWIYFAVFAYVLWPVFHWLYYNSTLKDALKDVPGLEFEPGGRWFQLPKVGTVRGTLKIEELPQPRHFLKSGPVALARLSELVKPLDAGARSEEPKAIAVGCGEVLPAAQSAPEAPQEPPCEVEIVLQKRRLDASIPKTPITLFPRQMGEAVGSVIKGLSRPVHLASIIGLHFFSGLMFLLFLMVPFGSTRPEEAVPLFFGAMVCSVFLFGASYASRTLRGQFPLRLANDEAKTGDEHFDKRFCVKGNEDLILAAFDYSTRKKLTSLSPLFFPFIEHGRFSMFINPTIFRSRKERFVRETAGLLAHLHQSLEPHYLDIPARLLRNVREDPVVGVKQRSLRWLHAKYPQSFEAVEAMEVALQSDSSELIAMAKMLQRGHEGTLEGQLSVPDEPLKAGQLSLPQGDEGQLSLPEVHEAHERE